MIECRIAACLLLFHAFASCPAWAGAMADLTRMDGVVTDDKRPGFVFKADKPHEVVDTVRIPREVSSVCAFVVEDGKARARTLKVRATNTEVVYAEGVKSGEVVVTRGQDLLSDGQPVRIIDSGN